MGVRGRLRDDLDAEMPAVERGSVRAESQPDHVGRHRTAPADEIVRERARLLEMAEQARAEAEVALRTCREVERSRDDLTNMVVHDLKNPLHGIRMMIQAALRRRDDVPAHLRDTLLAIDRSCGEIARMAQNVLEIGKIEAGEMPATVEPVILSEIAADIAAEYGPLAHETGHQLRVAVTAALPCAVADRALLKRVLVNLIVNALRHSGSVDVRVEAALEPDGRHVAVRVVDHGHGIPAADQAGIFEKFKTRSDPTADTGLGLAFCKLAVERMRGRIALSSAPRLGTTFTVTLPCASL